MDDLVAFVEQRLTEDELWAKAASTLHSSLLPVPTEVRSMARGYAQAKREGTDE